MQEKLPKYRDWEKFGKFVDAETRIASKEFWSSVNIIAKDNLEYHTDLILYKNGSFEGFCEVERSDWWGVKKWALYEYVSKFDAITVPERKGPDSENIYQSLYKKNKTVLWQQFNHQLNRCIILNSKHILKNEPVEMPYSKPAYIYCPVRKRLCNTDLKGKPNPLERFYNVSVFDEYHTEFYMHLGIWIRKN